MENNIELSNFSPLGNRIKDETKNKFDALLKQALNTKGRKNVQNIAAQRSVSDIESLTSSYENVQNISSLNEKPKQIEVVKVDVHEDSSNDNYILNKFLNDSNKTASSDEIITIDVNEPDVMFIKPPVPKPRRSKRDSLPVNSPSSSSMGTYKVNSPTAVKDISNSTKNEIETQSKVSTNIKENTVETEARVSSKIVSDKSSSDHESPLSSRISINKSIVNVAKILDKDVSSHKFLEEQNEVSEVLKADEIKYENEIKPKHKKHRKKSVDSKSTFKDVVETLMEDRKETKYAYEKIVGITIHKTDRLKLDSLVVHPVVKVHIVNAETGEYLSKSDKNRAVVFFYENKDILYITPVISEPYNLYEKRSLYPAWEETVIINEDVNFILENENNCIIFFEIMDFVPFSVANSQFYQKGSTKGWHKIAWAFLKLVSKNNELNIDKRVRLQLYYPNKQKKVAPHICPIFHWWHGKKLSKYPASLYISVLGIMPPEKVVESLRSKTPIHGEKASRVHFGSDIEKHEQPSPICNDKRDNHNENTKEVMLPKLEYKSFKLPNVRVAELPSYEEGCLIVKFSNNGLYLACTVLMDDLYSVVIFSVKTFEEVCKYSGHQGLIYTINWSKDDNLIITASADCTVCIWSFVKRTFIEMLPHPSYVYASDVSSTNLIATGCYDNIVRLWCCKANAAYDLIQELEGHKGYVTSLCFNSKCTCLYSSDSVGVIIEWRSNADNEWSLKREIKLADLRETVINQIVLHKRERKLLIHARDSTLRIMDIKTSYILQWLQGAINNRFNTTCSFSACGNYIFVGGENGFINAWKTDTGESVSTYVPYDGFQLKNVTIHCVQCHPHDNILASSHYGHNLPILLFGS